MMTVAAFAKDKNHHTVDIPETVKVGAGQLAPGKYTMEWSESEPTAEVTFLQEEMRLPIEGSSPARPSAPENLFYLRPRRGHCT